MIRIRARVQNSRDQHQTQVSTNDKIQSLSISPKESGFGSSLNGGELLFLALATCYCNDICREAAHASQEQIQHLMRITDRKAEIQNTLRAANTIPLQEARAIPIE